MSTETNSFTSNFLFLLFTVSAAMSQNCSQTRVVSICVFLHLQLLFWVFSAFTLTNMATYSALRPEWCTQNGQSVEGETLDTSHPWWLPSWPHRSGETTKLFPTGWRRACSHRWWFSPCVKRGTSKQGEILNVPLPPSFFFFKKISKKSKPPDILPVARLAVFNLRQQCLVKTYIFASKYMWMHNRRIHIETQHLGLSK